MKQQPEHHPNRNPCDFMKRLFEFLQDDAKSLNLFMLLMAISSVAVTAAIVYLVIRLLFT